MNIIKLKKNKNLYHYTKVGLEWESYHNFDSQPIYFHDRKEDIQRSISSYRVYKPYYSSGQKFPGNKPSRLLIFKTTSEITLLKIDTRESIKFFANAALILSPTPDEKNAINFTLQSLRGRGSIFDRIKFLVKDVSHLPYSAPERIKQTQLKKRIGALQFYIRKVTELLEVDGLYETNENFSSILLLRPGTKIQFHKINSINP